MLLRTINSLIEENGLFRAERVIADNNTCLLMLVPIALTAWFIVRQSKGLSIVMKRPSLSGGCAMLAASLEPCVIWLAQGIAILITVFAVYFFNDAHVVNRLIGHLQASTLFAFGLSVALFCCYLLTIRAGRTRAVARESVPELETSALVSAVTAANIQCLASVAEIGDDSRKWTSAELVKLARRNVRGK